MVMMVTKSVLVPKSPEKSKNNGWLMVELRTVLP